METRKERRQGERKKKEMGKLRTIKRRILKKNVILGKKEKRKERKHSSILRMLSLWMHRHCWRRGRAPGHCATIII